MQDFQQIRGRLGTSFPSHFVFLVMRGSFPFLSQARSRAFLVTRGSFPFLSYLVPGHFSSQLRFLVTRGSFPFSLASSFQGKLVPGHKFSLPLASSFFQRNRSRASSFQGTHSQARSRASSFQ